MAEPRFDLRQCLEGVARGDEAAARELVERCHPLVLKLVRAHLPRHLSDEDLAQEVYLKMTLPEPVGLVTELVRVLSLTPCEDEPGVFASVSFHQHIQGLGDLLDDGALPQQRRQAG